MELRCNREISMGRATQSPVEKEEAIDEGLVVIRRSFDGSQLPTYSIQRETSRRELARVSVFRCDGEYAVSVDSSVVSFSQTFVAYSGIIDAGLHADRRARSLAHYLALHEECECSPTIRT